MIYVAGMDLAESLNFWAIYVLSIDNGKVRVATAKKGKDTLYPELEAVVLKLYEKYHFTKIYTDYTSEKSFSEWLESHLHPAFKNRQSSQYKKWKIVEPVTFNQQVKLNMKQNARTMMEEGLFEWPKLSMTHPPTAAVIQETKDQMLREAGKSANTGTGMTKVHFPKPTGYDNDLIMALELALLGAREYLGHFSGSEGKPFAMGGRLIQKTEKDEKVQFEKKMKQRLAQFNITDMDIKYQL